MAVIRVLALSFAGAMLVGGCSFFGSTEIEVEMVIVSGEGQGSQIEVVFYPCIPQSEQPLQMEADEYDDRVEIHIDIGKTSDSDCGSAGVVALEKPLGDRVVVAGSDDQEFEYCGIDVLCPKGTSLE